MPFAINFNSPCVYHQWSCAGSVSARHHKSAANIVAPHTEQEEYKLVMGQFLNICFIIASYPNPPAMRYVETSQSSGDSIFKKSIKYNYMLWIYRWRYKGTDLSVGDNTRIQRNWSATTDRIQPEQQKHMVLRVPDLGISLGTFLVISMWILLNDPLHQSTGVFRRIVGCVCWGM